MNQRPIKFRVWHKPTKRMFDVYDFNEYVVFEDSMDGVESSDTLPADRADCILLQFTGLTTNDGTEIYEGDILRTEYTETTGPESSTIVAIHNLVEFRDGAFGYIGENTGKFCVFEYEGVKDGIYAGCTVAGNVFAHPELLDEPEEVKETSDLDFVADRYKQIQDVVPVSSRGLSNWFQWEESINKMAQLDKRTLTLIELTRLRLNFFDKGHSSLVAYKDIFVPAEYLEYKPLW